MGNDLGVFEAMENAGKLSAESAANDGYELEKSVDRAIFRAKEKFGAYLANAQSGDEFYERFAQIKPDMIKVIAEVTIPTPGVIRRVGAALRPPAIAQKLEKHNRPSSAKTASEVQLREAVNDHRDEVVPGSGVAIKPKDFTRVGTTQKHAWAYNQTTMLYTSNDPMQKFACPGCGTEQDSLGFVRCAGEGCGRTWNSWPVRQASSAKTGMSTYVLNAREIKMRGDQFKMAAMGNVKVADGPMGPMSPPPEMSQPSMGTMPGDNSGATGAPVPPEQPPTPGGDVDGDNDVAGGVTEGSPIDQIQDALQDAVMALKDVQMLSVNPQLSAMGSTQVKKVDILRTSMDRFWTIHKQMNYVAGMLAKEANEAIQSADPRITSEAEFVKGYKAAASNEPLPAKTGRAWLEGYVAFHKQGSSYDTGADIGKLTRPVADDETAGARNDGSFLAGDGLVPADEERSDAGPFDTSQPATSEFVGQIDAQNAKGMKDRGQGQSGSIQPTGARRTLPKGK